MNKAAVLPAVIFGVVLAVALTPIAAVAGPFEDGLAAYDSGDYTTAGSSLSMHLTGSLLTTKKPP